jgi:hypothetical protein
VYRILQRFGEHIAYVIRIEECAKQETGRSRRQAEILQVLPFDTFLIND